MKWEKNCVKRGIRGGEIKKEFKGTKRNLNYRDKEGILIKGIKKEFKE